MRSPQRLAAAALAALGLALASAVPAVAVDDIPTVENPGGIEAATSPGGVPSARVGKQLNTWLAASSAASITPGMAPRGANDWDCEPTEGKDPVVLIPGTGADAFSTWSFFSPYLASEGFCVYTLNYNPSTSSDASAFMGDIRQSAAFLAGFVDRVLEETGAQKVDIVGHSQGGGALPRAYIKWYGGAQKVDHLIGIAPNNHGTTVGGLQNLVEKVVGSSPTISDGLSARNEDALLQQLQGSEFFTELNEGGLTVPGVTYTVVATTWDTTITPYTNSFIEEPGVTNVTSQQICRGNARMHHNITYDPTTYQYVRNALDPSAARPVNCWWVPGYLPYNG